MSFSRKIFLSVFLSVFILGSSALWIAHSYVTKQNHQSFISRYSVFSTILGDTLSHLDSSSEALMLNAAKVLSERDKTSGTLATEKLKNLRSELNVTHLFVIDRKGNFIRSTNEDPKLIPNAFSFCSSYKNLYNEANSVESTPVLHPFPEPKPYKFLFIPSSDKSKLLEVGLRVDFVAKTLTDALGADSDILSLSLFAPNGLPLGQFKGKGVEFPNEKLALPATLPSIIEDNSQVKIYSKVTSSHPECCQCNVNGTSKNGEYYYVLESKVSKAELLAVQASTKNLFFFLLGLNLLFAFVLSKFLSRLLVKNIEFAVKRVQAIARIGIKQRIKLNGNDEIAFLTNEFDKVLDTLEESQRSVVEAEKMKAKMQLAREVAHNINSPAVAIEVTIPFLTTLPERWKKVLKDSASEIRSLANKLKIEADPSTPVFGLHSKTEPVLMGELIEKIFQDKVLELSNAKGIKLELSIDSNTESLFVNVDPIEFKSVISNLINNAAEAYPNRIGRIELLLRLDGETLVVTVQDYGKGIPESLLDRIGKEQISFDKPGGTGLGLYHMYRVVTSWGAEPRVESSMGSGTRISIRLNAFIAPSNTQTSQVEVRFQK